MSECDHVIGLIEIPGCGDDGGGAPSDHRLARMSDIDPTAHTPPRELLEESLNQIFSFCPRCGTRLELGG